jgi:DNA-binding XRE family transcriptional regulator
MPRPWTPDERVKQRAKQAAFRAAKVEANPHAPPLAKARVARELTQLDLSELAQVCKDSISGIENGRKSQSPTRALLSKALAMPESELFPDD